MTHYPAPPTRQPRPKGRVAKILGLSIGIPLLMLASCGTGAALTAGGQAEPEPAVTVTAEPLPAVTVTAEPLPAVTVTAEPVEVEKIVEVTPASCVEALDLFSQAINILSEYPQMVADAATAGSMQDAAGIEEVTAQMDDNGARIEAMTPDVQAAAQSCRAGE